MRDKWELTRKTADLLLDFGEATDRDHAYSLTSAICGSAGSSSTCCSATCSSLKQKRSALRPVIAELRRRFAVSAAETGSQELHRRAGVGAGGGLG